MGLNYGYVHNIPSAQQEKKKSSRVPRKNENQGRESDHSEKKGQGTRQISSLRKAADFRDVFALGQRIDEKLFSVCIRKNNSHNFRIGLAVSRKIGNAVSRNRVRRIYREALRKISIEQFSESGLRTSYDVIFLGKKTSVSVKMTDIYAQLKDVMEKIQG